MAHKVLDQTRIRALHTAAVTARLTNRRALLAGVPETYVTTLSSDGSPTELLLIDLNAMNGLALDDGSVPIVRWLTNALQLAALLPQSKVFQGALDYLSHPVARLVEVPAREVAPARPAEDPAEAPPRAPAEAPPSTDAGDHEITALQARIARQLISAPSVARALAEELGLDPGGPFEPALAEAIVKTSASQIALAFAVVFPGISGEREAWLDLLLEILQRAVDWHELVAEVRAALADGTGAIKLPLRTEAIAEIVLSGAARVPCKFFHSDDERLEGEAMIPLPSVAYAPLLPAKRRSGAGVDPKGIVRAVMVNLAKEAEPLRARGIWGNLRSRFPNDEDFSFVARDTITGRIKRRERGVLPHYVVFVDADILRGAPADLEWIWNEIKRAFHDELNLLQLVRLTGGPTELGKEYGIVDNLKSVYSGFPRKRP